MTHHKLNWLCRCDCGNEKIIATRSLDAGTVSCGCTNYRRTDLTNHVFGRLAVIGFAENTVRGKRIYYVCKCVCGKSIEVQYSHIVSGHTKSCGCINYTRQWKRTYDISLGKDFSQIYNRYKYGAEKRSLSFELTHEEVKSLITGNCCYCGIDKSTKEGYNGIDRVNSSQGYTKNNVVTCCKMCNQAKRDYSLGVFVDWIERLYKNIKLNPTLEAR